MQEEASVFGGPGASLEVRYTDKPVSGWGGLEIHGSAGSAGMA